LIISNTVLIEKGFGHALANFKIHFRFTLEEMQNVAKAFFAKADQILEKKVRFF